MATKLYPIVLLGIASFTSCWWVLIAVQAICLLLASKSVEYDGETALVQR